MTREQTLRKRIEENGEKYGCLVRKGLIERMPAHFVTGEFPKQNGRSDFITKAAYIAGANSLAPLLLELAAALKNIVANPVITGMEAATRNFARRHKTGGDNPVKEAKEALASLDRFLSGGDKP